MGRRVYKDGDLEVTVVTHGTPDQHMAAQAILPLVMAAIERERVLKQNNQNQPAVNMLIKD